MNKYIQTHRFRLIEQLRKTKYTNFAVLTGWLYLVVICSVIVIYVCVYLKQKQKHRFIIVCRTNRFHVFKSNQISFVILFLENLFNPVSIPFYKILEKMTLLQSNALNWFLRSHTHVYRPI